MHNFFNPHELFMTKTSDSKKMIEPKNEVPINCYASNEPSPI